MFETVLFGSLALLALALFGSFYRVIRGPSIADRVLALDTVGIHLIAMTAIVSIYLKTTTLLNIILLIGILAFVGTIAFSKFIERGVVIDRKRDD